MSFASSTKRIIRDYTFFDQFLLFVCACITHLQYGILEVVEVNRFEAFELRVTSTQVVQQRCQTLVVILNIVNDDSNSLHEPEGVIFEALVRHQVLAVEMPEAEDGLDERVSSEDEKEYSRPATAEVGRQNLPVFNDHFLVLLGKHNAWWRYVVGQLDIGDRVF